MNRRQFLGAATAATGLPAFRGLIQVGRARPTRDRPNIIFIMADDLGYGELGCYGQTKIRTPHVDQMAAEGMRFSQYYCGSPVSAPSRCVLMTGRHAGHASIRNNHSEKVDGMTFAGQFPLPSEEVTVAELLKSEGYVTGAFGKWGLGRTGSSGDPLKQGFDRFFGYNCQAHAHNLYPKYLVSDSEEVPLEGNTRGVTGRTYAPALIAEEALKFLRQNRDKPFFLHYPTVLPHLALQAPQEAIDAYRGLWEETPYSGKSYLPHPTPKACYAAMISFLDEQVGRLMASLKELGLDEKTIVFFTSDNGTTHVKEQVDHEFFESVGNLRGLKGSVYEGGIRVPMVVRWPGKIGAGRETDHLAAHCDVMATFADLVGIAPPSGTDSLSFLPTLLGERQPEHDYLFWDFKGYGGQIAVRMGRWKGVRKDLLKDQDAPLDLYDLKSDPSESENVAGVYPKIAKRMARIMVEGRTRPADEVFAFGEYTDSVRKAVR